MIGLLLLPGIVAAVAPASADTAVPIHYVASVSFWEGKCRYWTGDVMFDATQFRNDLKGRFDHKTFITIYHAAEIPAKCIRTARRMAAEAGFTHVEDEVGEVDLSPPR